MLCEMLLLCLLAKKSGKTTARFPSQLNRHESDAMLRIPLDEKTSRDYPPKLARHLPRHAMIVSAVPVSCSSISFFAHKPRRSADDTGAYFSGAHHIETIRGGQRDVLQAAPRRWSTIKMRPPYSIAAYETLVYFTHSKHEDCRVSCLIANGTVCARRERGPRAHRRCNLCVRTETLMSAAELYCRAIANQLGDQPLLPLMQSNDAQPSSFLAR